MSKKEITKQELIKELKELRQRIAELEKSETEHKKAEETLRLFSQATDNSVDGVAINNLKSRITYVNQAFVKMFGYSKKELIGKGIPFIYPKNQVPKLEKAFKATMQGGWTGELVGKRKNGELFPMVLSSSLIKNNKGTIIAHMAIHRDITERKQVEKALRESEIKYRTLVEHLPAIIYTAALDESSTTLYISPQIEKILGISPETYKADPDFWVKHLHDEDRERVLGEISRAHETEKTFASEYRMISMDGRIVWLKDEAVIVKDDKGIPLYLQGVMLDITERRKAEEALQRSERKYRTIAENVNDALIIHDFEGKIIDVNDNACVMFDQKRNKIIGEHLQKFSPEDPKNPTSPIINRLKKEKSLVFDSQVVYRDGSIIPVTISAKLVSEEGKGVIQSFIRDITERKKAEEELKKKNEDLERFNRIAVGRELKMVELKKEINSLLKEMEKEPQYKIPAEKTK